MNTALGLFSNRLKAEWKFQFEVFRTAVDWTVALYMVIPAVVYSVYHYLAWWRETPAWIVYVPTNLVIGAVFLFSSTGTVRVFLEDADQLFLIQRHKWLNTLIRASVIYSAIYNFFLASLVCLCLAPLLLFHYGFSAGQLLLFGAFIFGFKTAVGISKQFVALRFKGWTHRIVQGLVFALTGIYFRASMALLLSYPILFLLSFLFLCFALLSLIRKRLKLKGAFFEDIAREQYQRMRLANLLLRASGYHQKKLQTIRTRPLLFRSSNLIFRQRTPVNALIEVCIKSVLRNGGHIKVYLQLLFPALALILVLPTAWGWLLWFGFAAILTNFVALFWREAVNSPFIQLFHWTPEQRVTAAAKAFFWMALPGFLLLSLAFGLKNYSWVVALGTLPMGTLIVYFTSKFVSLWQS